MCQTGAALSHTGDVCAAAQTTPDSTAEGFKVNVEHGEESFSGGSLGTLNGCKLTESVQEKVKKCMCIGVHDGTYGRYMEAALPIDLSLFVRILTLHLSITSYCTIKGTLHPFALGFVLLETKSYF